MPKLISLLSQKNKPNYLVVEMNQNHSGRNKTRISMTAQFRQTHEIAHGQARGSLGKLMLWQGVQLGQEN